MAAALYPVVDKSGAKRWVFLFRWQGKLKEMGLGSTLAVSACQRPRAQPQRLGRSACGAQPDRRAARRRRQGADFRGDGRKRVIESISHGLRNAKHIAQWRMTLSVERDRRRPARRERVLPQAPQKTRLGNHHSRRTSGASANMDDESGDRLPRARPDRASAGRRQSEGTAHREKTRRDGAGISIRCSLGAISFSMDITTPCRMPRYRHSSRIYASARL